MDQIKKFNAKVLTPSYERAQTPKANEYGKPADDLPDEIREDCIVPPLIDKGYLILLRGGKEHGVQDRQIRMDESPGDTYTQRKVDTIDGPMDAEYELHAKEGDIVIYHLIKLTPIAL